MGHQGYQSNEEGHKRHMTKRKSLGLCVSCSNKAVQGLTRCKYHRKDDNRRGAERRSRIKKLIEKEKQASPTDHICYRGISSTCI